MSDGSLASDGSFSLEFFEPVSAIWGQCATNVAAVGDRDCCQIKSQLLGEQPQSEGTGAEALSFCVSPHGASLSSASLMYAQAWSLRSILDCLTNFPNIVT